MLIPEPASSAIVRNADSWVSPNHLIINCSNSLFLTALQGISDAYQV